MATPITFETLVRAVNLPAFDPTPAHFNMSPSGRRLEPPEGIAAREAGVLELVYPHDGVLRVVLTRRNDALRGHSGQISFPGGRRDSTDESFTATALRETCEELGLCEGIQVIGTLSPMYIPPSNFKVYPTVGYVDAPPVFTPNEAEVAEIFSVSLDDLINPQLKSIEERVIQGTPLNVPFYLVSGHKVWGATAIMLSELEQRLLSAQTQTP